MGSGSDDSTSDMGSGLLLNVNVPACSSISLWIFTASNAPSQISGDPDTYEKLGLLEADNPTLQFVPDVPGTMPELGASVPWGGNNFVVKNRNTLAMAGTATAAHLVIGK